MKNFILIFCLITTLTWAQEKRITKTGKITFEASVPAFEEVKAKSETATCILNTNTGEIAALVLIKSFKFKVALMEEHFNENYLESSTYPKATFKGSITKFELAGLSDISKTFTITGTLELHGKSKLVSFPAKIKQTAGGIEIVASFSVNADDFGIEIPAVVKSKVSKKVQIDTYFLLK